MYDAAFPIIESIALSALFGLGRISARLVEKKFGTLDDLDALLELPAVRPPIVQPLAGAQVDAQVEDLLVSQQPAPVAQLRVALDAIPSIEPRDWQLKSLSTPADEPLDYVALAGVCIEDVLELVEHVVNEPE